MNRRSICFALGCFTLVTIAGRVPLVWAAAGTATSAGAATTVSTPSTAGPTSVANTAVQSSAVQSSASADNTRTSAAQSSATASTSAPPAPTEAPPAPSKPFGERVKNAWNATWQLASELAFERWSSPVFDPPFWHSTMNGIRIALPLLLALVVVARWLVQRGYGVVPERLANKAALGFIVAGFVAYYAGFNPNVRNGGLYQVNGYYQQFFEAKYHAELEGVWLFDCTLAAEKELGRTQQFGQRLVRTRTQPETLTVAGLTLGAEEPEQCASRFSEQRWEAFKSDITTFSKQVDTKTWGKLQSERRMVQSPTWLTIVPWITPSLPQENVLRWSALAQVLLHAATLVAVATSFGFAPAAVLSVVWGCQPFMPFDLGVELFQALWLELCICGLCALFKRSWVLATWCLSLGLALQPLALFVVVVALVVWARGLWLSQWREHAPRLLLPALIACTSGWLALGCAGGSYQRYTSALEFRASLPSPTDVGLGTLFTHDASKRLQVLRQDALPDPAEPWVQRQAQALSETRVLRGTALCVVFLGALVAAWFQRSLWAALAAGLIPVSLLMQPLAMCLGFIPVALCSARRADLWPAVLTATAGSAFLSTHAVFADDRAVISSALVLLTTLVVALPLLPRPWLLRWRSTPTAAQLDSAP